MKKYNLCPKVSIVCAWYNRADYIETTLSSLLAQDFDDYQIVVIDDGSSDGRVKEILQSYVSPNLKIVHQSNMGFTATIGTAIEEVNSPYVCVMGAGDIAHKDKIKKQYEYMERNKKVSAVGCGHNLVSAASGKVLGYIAPVERANRELLKTRVPFTHGSVMYRRCDVIAAGSYDPFFKNCQDWDLYCRLLAIGEIHAINEALYSKFIFSDGVSFSPDQKIVQSFYKSLARSQNRELIDYYKSNSEHLKKYINKHSVRYAPFSLKMIAAFIRQREWGLAFSWGVLFRKQVFKF